MGALGSELMATIVPDFSMPTRWASAPEMPHATYRRGRTFCPVWPTWLAAGYQPRSTSGIDTATMPPSADASSSSSRRLPASAPHGRQPR